MKFARGRLRRFTTTIRLIALAALFVGLGAGRALALEQLCDSSFENCRTRLISLIQNENVEIDVGLWFMEDARYSNAIVARWQAGVPVRILMDPRANATNPFNGQTMTQLANAGIPMRKRIASGIEHWKMMLFAGQNTVYFGSANFSDIAFVPIQPYVNYVDETVYFTDDASVVQSFMTKFDDAWTDTTNYANFANATTGLTRHYSTFLIDPELNFPPGEDYANRAVKRYNAETQKIDVEMFRITDQRHTNAIISAFTTRHVAVRMIVDPGEYRNASRLWDAWNVDRLYAAGIPIRITVHQGENHGKLMLLYSQDMTIFGSSNWSSPSANSQHEHNYFTVKSNIFTWFVNQFERKWNNTNPVGAAETGPFTPKPPDKPVYVSPANTATGIATTGVSLKWDGGPWAHNYDIYFGTSPTPPLFAANVNLGPDDPTRSPKQYQTFALPTLTGGTTYYWQIVSKTMANLTATGPIWSFTTAGTPPPPPPGVTTVVMWAANVAASDIHGNWQMIADSTAAGGHALQNPDQGQAKIAPALSAPANYFETTFQATTGVAYHLWVRMRAQSNSLSNDSVHVQFSDSTDSVGSATQRIGTSSSAEVVLQNGPNGAADHGWGWSDNGWGSLGPNIYFASTGTHTVRIQQREDGAIVDQIVLSPDTYIQSPPGPRQDDTTILTATDGGSTGGGGSTLPSPWTDADIGAVPFAGSAQYSNGAFTITGSGADIWGTADAFHYVYQPLKGDATIQARIASVQNANSWSKAGVMIRETLDAGSAQAIMLVSSGKGVAFQRRDATGATSVSTGGSLSAPPRWVQLQRSGDTFTASESADGTTWTVVGTDTIPMASDVFVGLAVTSHTTSASTTAVADSVTIGAGSPPPSPTPPPSPWVERDIGAVPIAGSTTYSSGTFTVKASGADIWGTADAFQYVYQPLSSDGSIVARVASVTAANQWSKAGVMIRETLDPGSAHAFMLVSSSKGVALQWRPSTGGTSLSAAGTLSTPPRWVRLDRSGDSFTGFESADGVNWTVVTTTNIPMAQNVFVGLAATSHTTSAQTTATIDHVSVP
jgi:phosphatidylserine/phosphatidylglycerophosphate/cardiolipin synthase-like enzyme/regulation of enolase protein 1 (concanavalin A-like superfamily)